MEKTDALSTTRWKAVGAAVCAGALCLYLAAFSAGSLDAYAEPESGDGVASLSGTETVTRSYYAPVGQPMNMAFNSHGKLVLLPLNDDQSIDLEALQALDVAMGSEPEGVDSSECERRSIRVIITVPDPVEPEPAEDAPSSPSQPQATQNPSVPTTAPTTEPEAPPAAPAPEVAPPEAATPTTPQQQPSAPEQVLAPGEPELLKLECYESEVDQKVAELTAQGFEIVRIEKMPRWWR